MLTWQYNAHVGDVIDPKDLYLTTRVSLIWEMKDKSGKTSWDKIQEMGNEGWELVSVTPITVFIHKG
jgi:hypothetical protein